MLQQIIYLPHNQIDRQKWDDVISNSINCRPYALSWYLDLVSPNWEAFIIGDYEVVMPLTVKRKFGFTYLVQPFQTQQLGVFSPNPIEKTIIENFIATLYKRFRYIHIHLNALNHFGQFPAAPNYILHIDKPFNDLCLNFSENHRRNLKKLNNTSLKSVIDFRETQQIHEFLRQQEIQYYNKDQLKKVLIYTDEIYRQGSGCWQVAFNSSNEMVAIIFWFYYNNRHIYYFSYASDIGKKQLATFYLVFEYLKHCQPFTLIDFEGSKIPGVARFFSGFGAVAEYYPVLKHIRLF